MPWVKELDDMPIEDKIRLLNKIAIQRTNLRATDFSRAISVFAEIKPLSALYKPIQDSMSGIFGGIHNFKVNTKTGNTTFTDVGITAFIDDLLTKNIRSSYTIAQNLQEVSMNGAHIGNLRSNYAMELAGRFAKILIDEMTLEQMIDTIEDKLTIASNITLPSDSIKAMLDSPRAKVEDSPRAKVEEDGLKISGIKSSIPAGLQIQPSVERTRKSWNTIFGASNYRGAYDATQGLPSELDPLRIYKKKNEYYLLGDKITKSDFEDGTIKLYGQEVPLTNELIQLLQQKSQYFSGKKSKDPNTAAILALAYKNNPTAFNFPGNKTKRQFLEAPFKGTEEDVFGSGLIMTSVPELEQRFKLLLAERVAGNDSKKIVTQLKLVADTLFKKNKLTKKSNMMIQRIP